MCKNADHIMLKGSFLNFDLIMVKGEQPNNGDEQRGRLSSLDSPFGSNNPQKCPRDQVPCAGVLSWPFIIIFTSNSSKVLSEREHIADYMQVLDFHF